MTVPPLVTAMACQAPLAIATTSPTPVIVPSTTAKPMARGHAESRERLRCMLEGYTLMSSHGQ